MEVESITEDLEIPLPVLDGIKNFHRWSVMMGLLFNFHEVMEIVQKGISEVEESASKEKDSFALSLIHQCVNSEILGLIGAAKSAKEAWNMLLQMYQGVANMSEKGKWQGAGEGTTEGSSKKNKVQADSNHSVSDNVNASTGDKDDERKVSIGCAQIEVKVTPGFGVEGSDQEVIFKNMGESESKKKKEGSCMLVGFPVTKPKNESEPEDSVTGQEPPPKPTEANQHVVCAEPPEPQPSLGEFLKLGFCVSPEKKPNCESWKIRVLPKQSSIQREEREPVCDGMVAAIDVSEKTKLKPDLEEVMVAKAKPSLVFNEDEDCAKMKIHVGLGRTGSRWKDEKEIELRSSKPPCPDFLFVSVTRRRRRSTQREWRRRRRSAEKEKKKKRERSMRRRRRSTKKKKQRRAVADKSCVTWVMVEKMDSQTRVLAIEREKKKLTREKKKWKWKSGSTNQLLKNLGQGLVKGLDLMGLVGQWLNLMGQAYCLLNFVENSGRIAMKQSGVVEIVEVGLMSQIVEVSKSKSNKIQKASKACEIFWFLQQWDPGGGVA